MGKWNKSNEIWRISSELRCLLCRKIMRKLFTCSTLILAFEGVDNMFRLGHSGLFALLHVGQDMEEHEDLFLSSKFLISS